uniref:Uncharacterized protein n=1 Tax=Onchocerca volvulus TaxID=6282 RepID=A0A8R1Y3D8_ONCVO
MNSYSFFKASRQPAGRSVGDFDDLSTSIKNTGKISGIILKNQDNTVESSLSEEEIQTLPKNFTSQSTENNDTQIQTHLPATILHLRLMLLIQKKI